MVYDFDTEIDRISTSSVKWSFMKSARKLRDSYRNIIGKNSTHNNLFGIVAQEAAYNKGGAWLEERARAVLKRAIASLEKAVREQ